MDGVAGSYDAIAEWYDTHIDGPIYEEIILPGILELAGNVQGLQVLDLACGQGCVARELARRGAHVTGVDLSRKLLAIGQTYDHSEPLGVEYIHDDARSLRRLGGSLFDGVVCAMALMDIDDFPVALEASHRVLRPNGWLISAVTHPCFEVPGGRWVIREDGTAAREVTGYFAEGFWTSSNPTGVRGQVGAYHRMLSTYLNAFADAGYCLEHMLEPQATGQRLTHVPGNHEIPSFMLLRFRTV